MTEISSLADFQPLNLYFYYSNLKISINFPSQLFFPAIISNFQPFLHLFPYSQIPQNLTAFKRGQDIRVHGCSLAGVIPENLNPFVSSCIKKLPPLFFAFAVSETKALKSIIELHDFILAKRIAKKSQRTIKCLHFLFYAT